MKAALKRGIAVTGSTLLLAGFAAPAMANHHDDDDDRRGDDRRGSRSCSIDLDQNRRTLDIELNTNQRNGTAWVTIDFDTPRGDRGDQRVRVSLDRRGDAEGSVRIPARADSVEVSARVLGTGISCDEDLDLDRRDRA
jgi:hypothetical protein